MDDRTIPQVTSHQAQVNSDTRHRTQDTKCKGYKKLIVWDLADQLTVIVYKITKTFPRDELFGLTSQIRRAAASIPTNIAEAMGRQNKNETKQFINIALGSLAEVEYLLELCHKLEFLDNASFNELEGLRSRVGGLLWKLYKSF